MGLKCSGSSYSQYIIDLFALGEDIKYLVGAKRVQQETSKQMLACTLNISSLS